MSLSTEIQADTPSATGLEPAAAQLHALLSAAGTVALDDLGWISVTGEDRVRWLNGMVTNSIADLAPGQGCYNFILSAQGRIQGTAYAFAQPDSILLQTDRAQIPNLIATLDRFIIMDDVELTDVTEILTGIALIGPLAPALLAAIDLTAPTSDALELAHLAWHSASINLLHAHGPLVPRFELWTDAATSRTLLEALTIADAVPCGPQAPEWLRILEGIPRYGIDIRNTETAKELPQETAQSRALHFSKGCYLGQEIVERIRSRGNVHRTFSGFRITGALPAAGASIETAGKVVGELTSVAAIPLSAGLQQIGLGYIRREALETAATLACAGTAIHPISLPVRQP